MNPMFGLFMNMGIGCMPSPFMMGMNFMMPSFMCGCSNFMTMPYYQNDNLGFLNNPVFRDTSSDFLLDPNLALRNCQLNWQNGGGIFGSTILPGFSFPQFSPIAPIGLPTAGGSSAAQPSQKTEEERKTEKEKEDKKIAKESRPEHTKAKKEYALFNSLKKLAEEKTNLLPEIPEELTNKVEEAMKKETAEEELKAIQEAMSAIPADILRKAALADDEVRKKLRKAGYNFDYSENKYSLKDPDAYVLNIAKLETDIKAKTYDELQKITGDLSRTDNAKAEILGIISAWNNAHKTSSDRGIIRYITTNLPQGQKEDVLLGVAKDRIKALTEALITKADEFSGYEKIASARDEVSKQLEVVIADSGFTKANLNKLADAFDKLYVRLRMQEAVAVRDYLKTEFDYLNEIHEGTISDSTIIEETEKDLKAEGLAPVAVKDLDKAPQRQQIQINERVELRDLDDKFKDDGKAKLETLYSQFHCVKKVNDSIYQTAASLNVENGKVRYFEADENDNKIYEVFKVTKTENGKQVTEYVREEGAAPVSPEEIAEYDATVNRVNKWCTDKVIGYYPYGAQYKSKMAKGSCPLFYATGSTADKYAIKDGKFCHIVNAKKVYIKLDTTTNTYRTVIDFNDGRTAVYLDSLDVNSNDLEVVTDVNEIKTAKQVKEEKEKEAKKDIELVQSHQYSSLNDIAGSNEEMDKISEEVTGEKGKFGKVDTKVEGFFWCEMKDSPNKRYYKYDIKTGKLKYLEGVKEVTSSGYLVKTNGAKVPCVEVFIDKEYTAQEMVTKIQEYGLSFAKIVSGHTKDESYPEAYKKLNTIIALNNPVYTINFIKGYQSNTGIFTAQDKGMFKQMYEEADPGFPCEGKSDKICTMEYYVKEFAKLLLKAVDVTGFDRNSEEYKDLKKIANGEFVNGKEVTISFLSRRTYIRSGIHGTALRLDEITEKVIEAFDKQYGNIN